MNSFLATLFVLSLAATVGLSNAQLPVAAPVVPTNVVAPETSGLPLESIDTSYIPSEFEPFSIGFVTILARSLTDPEGAFKQLEDLFDEFINDYLSYGAARDYEPSPKIKCMQQCAGITNAAK